MADNMEFNNISDLNKVRVNNAKFRKEKPVAVIDGIAHRINDLKSKVEGYTAYVVGVNDDLFQRLCGIIQVRTLYFYEMRVEDLRPLLNQSELVRLAIHWNTKLVDLSPLGKLTSLQTLILEDTPKAHDISALSTLANLSALGFSGGSWNKNTATSLSPISNLTNLCELELNNIKVENGGLYPLALCQSLKHLSISNQFPTEEFAYLAAHLRKTKCRCFRPWVRLNQPIQDKDIMVIGKRKPFLNSQTDQKLMDKYSDEFLSLVLNYSPKHH